jgi:hypothetical protein
MSAASPPAAKAQRDAAASARQGAADAIRPIQAPQPEESLGTGHGARESSYASYTNFVRASNQPDEIDSVWYDSYRNLVAQGVIRAPRPLVRSPQPFPNHFVPDPAD